MFRRLTVLMLFLIAAGEMKAQEMHFSQFYANPLFLNPALAGSGMGPRFIANYRNQWPSLPGGAFVTYAASYDQHFDALSGGIGIQAIADRMGDNVFQHNMISGTYANVLKINRQWTLRTGFQASYNQKRLDWSGLIFPDEIDPRLGIQRGTTQENLPNTGQTNVNFFNFSAGMMAYSEKYYGGIAVAHLTQPNQSLLPSGTSPLHTKITVHGGANIPLSKRNSMNKMKTSISPNIIFQQQNAQSQLNIGTYINHGPVVGGVWHRVGDSFILLAGIQSGVFRFGYSYDITTSRLRSAAIGSHEISMTLQFDELQRTAKNKITKIKCPTF